jgi:hypothetical protein
MVIGMQPKDRPNDHAEPSLCSQPAPSLSVQCLIIIQWFGQRSVPAQGVGG